MHEKTLNSKNMDKIKDWDLIRELDHALHVK